MYKVIFTLSTFKPKSSTSQKQIEDRIHANKVYMVTFSLVHCLKIFFMCTTPTRKWKIFEIL